MVEHGMTRSQWGGSLDGMSQTIGVLEGEVEKSRTYLDRAQRTDARLAGGELDLGDAPPTRG